MSVENYLRQRVNESWSPEEIQTCSSNVPKILNDFYFQARRGLGQGIPMFETRNPEGRMRALIDGLGVKNIIVGVRYEVISGIKNKGELLMFLEELALGAHSRGVVNLTGCGRYNGEKEHTSKEFRKTQKRNVKDFWKKE